MTSASQALPSRPTPDNTATRALFAPLAADYEVWSRVLSFGQDPLWRRRMVAGLHPRPGQLVLDVAAGTGEVTRLLTRAGARVISVDLSPQMLAMAHDRGARAVLARAEQLPFPDARFAHLSFTYLLRYVADPVAQLAELARVVAPGGRIGMVEFGLPRGPWNPLWRLYTGRILPAAGRLISPGWLEVGEFLRGSIEDLHSRYPDDAAWTELFESAGLRNVLISRPSLGGGIVVLAEKP